MTTAFDPQRELETLDSSKLRSNTVAYAEKVGIVGITRYGRIAGYVASPRTMDVLWGHATQYAVLTEQLHRARPLMLAASRLGVDPAHIVTVLFTAGGENGETELDVQALAELVAEAADDIDAARIARQRLARPETDDVDLDDVAAELGFDIEAMRAEVAAGRVTATVTT